MPKKKILFLNRQLMETPLLHFLFFYMGLRLSNLEYLPLDIDNAIYTVHKSTQTDLNIPLTHKNTQTANKNIFWGYF